jgi:membrane protein
MAKSSTPAANQWSLWQIIKQALTEFSEDKCQRLGAALAYYTIFSIAPLLVIAVGIVGWVLHKQNVPADQNPVVKEVAGLIGGGGGDAIKTMVKHMSEQPKHGVVATVIGFVTLLFGATGVFGELQDSLNTIWEVMPKPGRTVMEFLRQRFLSFTMVAGVCFLLLVSLIVSAGLSAVQHLVGGAGVLHYLWDALNVVISLVVISALFALMFKYLPDVKMEWKDTLVGAVATAVLFTIGKAAIGLYLGKASVGSAYGAVGSLVVLLLWIYYSSLIFLIGAEFTHVYACHRGSKYAPAEHAIDLSEVQRMHEGIPHNKTVEALAGGTTQAASAGASKPATSEPSPHYEIPHRKKAKPTSAPSRALPAAVGFALGLAAARFRRGPKPKKLILAPGVRVRATPPKAEPERHAHPKHHGDPDYEQIWKRFRKGWERGRDKVDQKNL